MNWLTYYPIEKWLSRCTDKLITITDEDYRLAKSRFSCEVERIHGVGANSERYRALSAGEQAAQREELGLSGPVLLNVGELLPNKNQKTAILAMKHLLPFCPDAQLLIAGNGRERDKLERLIAAEDLQAHVALLGYTTQLPRYMQVCDALVCCSYREGLPLNVVEAMLCGKPVVASHNRGHDELIRDGVNGYLVDADNAAAFAEKLRVVLEDPSRFTESALAGAWPYTQQSVTAELRRIYSL